MGTGWELTKPLLEKIYKYAAFDQTPISLRLMVQFGPNPSPGSIFLASQFIVEELPIRLAKKVKSLENAPLGLDSMPSTIKVKNWYAQSFQELTELKKPVIDENLRQMLLSSEESRSDDSRTSSSINNESGVATNGSSSGVSNTSAPPSNSEYTPFSDFSDDDGIVYRSRYLPSPYAQTEDTSTTTSIQSSPTANKSYYNPCPTNIVWPKEVYDYNKLVCDALTKIKKRHDATVATMAQGVKEWKSEHQLVFVNSQIQAFLDKFYMSRIGIRMLIGQHIALNMQQASPTRQRLSTFFNGKNGSSSSSLSSSNGSANGSSNRLSKPNYVGVICTDCNVSDIAQDAIDTASYICEEHYGLFEAPEIQLITPNNDINFMYVPGHLIHMLFETLKNSLRATIEFHTPKLKQQYLQENPGTDANSIDLNDLKFPPIKVIISEGYEDIAIKVSDEGGGIARSEVPLIWTYLYTTVKEAPTLEQDGNNNSFRAPMAGFGYGLPISRLYAQYFGGDLKLISMEGYGTDVYLHLNRLSSSLEPLP
ncbi:uncharacterized protein KQ657_004701 [Scheffersomyces spartinae]|uniref:Protein-serine/threonine kinase n=1 Tax=Scheffersomyces spartinae TaxID=45513 RepID=A0A9P7VAS3_9ASCO|nr:uncharacterized protein KQ657_004701 [Scheffersomyces spartinae]KAG7194487.1 hypothetical protein KQ657_004701 [Scheffersomyces spartinae]